jgi:phosphatidylinositol glycan class B
MGRPITEGSTKITRLVLCALACLPAVIAVAQLGRIHPDEVYQLLEPAYHRAMGYGVLSWEWQTGLRNWALPMVYAALLKLSFAAGVTDPLGYRALLVVPQLLLHVWALFAAHRYAARRLSPRSALLSAFLVALYAPVLTFAGRTMGESFSGAFLVIALEALDREERPWRAGLLGGLALGLAVVVRYSSAVMVVAALLWLLAARRWRHLAATALSGALVLGALALLDQQTWGKPLHSLLAYLEFNVTSGKAEAEFGREPLWFYLPRLLLHTAPWVWLGLWAEAKWHRPRLPIAPFCALLYLVAISLTPHKETRFLYPALLVLAVAAAPAAIAALDRLGRVDLRGALASLMICASLGPWFVQSELSVQRPDQFRALVKAQRGATGLLIVNEGIWGAGGYFYLGKNIPWSTCDYANEVRFQGAMADPRVNRVVTYDGRALPELKAAGFEVLEEISQATVLGRP